MMYLCLNILFLTLCLSFLAWLGDLILSAIEMRSQDRYSYLKFSFLGLPIFITIILSIGYFGHFRAETLSVPEMLYKSSAIDQKVPLLGAIYETDGESGGIHYGLILFILYVCVVIYRLLQLILSQFALNNLLHEAQFWRDNVFIHHREAAPLSFGIIWPVILIPEKIIADFNENNVSMIIAHENEHIRRYDPLFNLLRNLVEAFLFFSPFVILLSKRFEEEMEKTVDENLLNNGKNQKQYASLLVQLNLLNLNSNKAACNGAAGPFLKRRIIAMKSISKKVGAMWVLATLLILVGASFWIPQLNIEAVAKSTAKLSNKAPQSMQLNTFVVNLGLQDENRVLKVDVGFELDSLAAKQELEQRIMQVRDIIVILLSNKSLVDISDANGKLRLKQEIQQTINLFMQEGKITKVFFPSFLHS